MTSYPGETNSKLKRARLPVIENRWCRHIEEVVCLGYVKEAKAKKPNLCMYDSGGPLVCPRDLMDPGSLMVLRALLMSIVIVLQHLHRLIGILIGSISMLRTCKENIV